MGINETKEVILALFKLAAAIAKAGKDGLDLGDVVALMGNEEVKVAMSEAAKGIGSIPAEIKDISFGEAMELAAMLIKEIPALLEALKK